MELFRTQPSLCSLFLRLLEEWGAETLDWSLLRDEVFVDRFLRRLLVSQEIEGDAIFKACCSLLQPSIGGLLVAPILARGGHFDQDELDSFVEFAVLGQANVWDPISWPEMLTVLEEVAFTREEPAVFLAAMLANGWVPESLRDRFRRRVRDTCRLPLAQKQMFESWLAGRLVIPGVGPAPRESGLVTRVAGRSTDRFAGRRRGFSVAGQEAPGSCKVV